jgi:hypothetical protein
LLNRYPGIRPPRSHEGRIEYWDKWFGDKQLIDITKTDVKESLALPLIDISAMVCNEKKYKTIYVNFFIRQIVPNCLIK